MANRTVFLCRWRWVDPDTGEADVQVRVAENHVELWQVLLAHQQPRKQLAAKYFDAIWPVRRAEIALPPRPASWADRCRRK